MYILNVFCDDSIRVVLRMPYSHSTKVFYLNKPVGPHARLCLCVKLYFSWFIWEKLIDTPRCMVHLA